MSFEIEGFANLREIGRGGFSVVYSADQVAFGRRVAIKVLDVSASDARRIQRESVALGRLADIPAVITAYEALTLPDGRAALVMALMETSLGTLTKSSGPVDPELMLRWLQQVATGLDEAHARGVHHRDIKPDNVLISAAGDAYLADFGIAGLDSVDSGTTTAFSLSPQHASPERLGDDVTDPTADDIYSLGSTVYTALAGRPPFGTAAEGGVHGLISRVMNDAPPAAQSIPAAAQAVLARALAKQPSDRPNTANEFFTELSAAYGAGVETADDDRTVRRPAAGFVAPAPPPVPPPYRPQPAEPHRPQAAAPDSTQDTSPAASDTGGATSERSPRRRRVLIGSMVVVPLLVAAAVFGLSARDGEDDGSEDGSGGAADTAALIEEYYDAVDGHLPAGAFDCMAEQLAEQRTDPQAVPQALLAEFRETGLQANPQADPSVDSTTADYSSLLSDVEATCMEQIITTGNEPTVLADAAQVAVSGSTGCALTIDGDTACWGDNSSGIVVDEQGFGAQVLTFPVAVNAPKATSITGGGFDSVCVLTADGDAYCNDHPATVDVDETGAYQFPSHIWTAHPRTELQQVDVGGPVTSLAEGRNHRCAALANGSVGCAGSNESGQLGDGTRDDHEQFEVVPGLTGASQVTVGGQHTCALAAGGAVHCWGFNGRNFGFDPTPQLVAGLPPMSQIAAGSGFTCGVATDGSVWCWGYLTEAIGDTENSGVRPAQISTDRRTTSIAVDGKRVCTVSDDRAVWCFGEGRPLPTQVLGVADVQQVAVSEQMSCVVTTEAAIQCWGHRTEPLFTDEEFPGSSSQPSWVPGFGGF